MKHFGGTAVDAQHVRCGRVGSQAHVAFVDDVVDAVVIPLQNLPDGADFLADLSLGFLFLLVRGDVVADGIEAEGNARLVAHQHQPVFTAENAFALLLQVEAFHERNLVEVDVLHR